MQILVIYRVGQKLVYTITTILYTVYLIIAHLVVQHLASLHNTPEQICLLKVAF